MKLLKSPLLKTKGLEKCIDNDTYCAIKSTTSNLPINIRCGSKNPPHANEMNFSAELTHVFVGENALGRVAESYYWVPQDYAVAAMALPLHRSPYEFTWPVRERVVIILSIGECNETILQLGDALIKCGASKVIATVDDKTVVWIQPAEQKEAA